MPFNGSGTFVSLPAPDFPALPGTTILASSFNANMNDVFTNGLTNCLTRDGQSPPTANLPMAGFRFTNLGNGVNDTDSAALGQVTGLRGQVGVVDWDTRVLTGIFEATAPSLTSPATNFPPTTDLGMLHVVAQGALVNQVYVTAFSSYQRQKIGGVFTAWVSNQVGLNLIVNSGLQLWSRGTSLVSGTGRRYLADQVPTNSVGTTYVPTQQSFAVGQTDVNPEARFFIRNVVTSVANAANFCAVEMPIESVRTMAGKQVTFSFYAKAGSSLPVSVELAQHFGTGGGPSAEVDVFAGKVTLTTSWARYQVTATLANISGKTLGSVGDDCLVCRIFLDAGSNFNARTGTLGQQSGTFDFWGMKLEGGPDASPYVFPPILTTVNDCSRYYQNGKGSMAGYGVSAAAEVTNYPIAPMLFTPGMAFVNTGSSNVTTFSGLANSPRNFNPTCILTSAGASGFNINFDWSATASLL